MSLVKKVCIPIYIGDIPTSSIHKITIPNTLTVFMQILNTKWSSYSFDTQFNLKQEKIHIFLILIIIILILKRAYWKNKNIFKNPLMAIFVCVYA